MSEFAENTPDTQPQKGDMILAALWLLLFGGRWLLMPVLQVAGMVTPQQVTALDNGLLLELYLVLLAITCVMVALRAVRRTQHGSAEDSPGVSASALPLSGGEEEYTPPSPPP